MIIYPTALLFSLFCFASSVQAMQAELGQLRTKQHQMFIIASKTKSVSQEQRDKKIIAALHNALMAQKERLDTLAQMLWETKQQIVSQQLTQSQKLLQKEDVDAHYSMLNGELRFERFDLATVLIFFIEQDKQYPGSSELIEATVKLDVKKVKELLAPKMCSVAAYQKRYNQHADAVVLAFKQALDNLAEIVCLSDLTSRQIGLIEICHDERIKLHHIYQSFANFIVNTLTAPDAKKLTLKDFGAVLAQQNGLKATPLNTIKIILMSKKARQLSTGDAAEFTLASLKKIEQELQEDKTQGSFSLLFDLPAAKSSAPIFDVTPWFEYISKRLDEQKPRILEKEILENNEEALDIVKEFDLYIDRLKGI